jgi:DNA-binding beta-propeller fold protein YncE
MIKNKKVFLWVVGLIAICVLATVTAYLTKASKFSVLFIPSGAPYRILPGSSQNSYWVVNREHGLVFVSKGIGGIWFYSLYNIGRVFDATGPDSNGLIYCSFTDLAPSYPCGVYVFDSVSRTVVDTISLDRMPSGLSLSSDGQNLYVAAWGWPLPDEPYNEGDAVSHPDSGIIWKIDVATRQIIAATSVGALPSTIYTFPSDRGDRLIVSQHQIVFVETTGSTMHYIEGENNQIDIVDATSFTRIAQLDSPWNRVDNYSYTMLDWADGVVAVCCPAVSYEIQGHPELQDGIWLVDPVSATVVNRVHITDGNGVAVGAFHAVVSQTYPSQAYVSLAAFQSPSQPSGDILVVDYPSGQYIRSIDITGSGCLPFFMQELSDGNLMVTGGETGKILIIDPT